MPSIRNAFGLLALLLITPTPATAQDEPPELETVFADDFSEESRDQYEIEGDVSWQPGQLTLAEGASITREINGGAWARVELDFGEAGWVAGDHEAELRIWFLLDGATDCFVRLRRSLEQEAGQASSVAMVDTLKQDGQPIARVVRELPLPEGKLSHLSVEYRYGLVAVTVDQSVLLTAHIANGTAAVIGSRVHAADGSPRLDGWMATGLPASPPLTEEQRRQAAEATTANEKLISIYKQGNLAEAAEVGERVLELLKTVLGEQHPDYATVLNELALIYESMDEHSRAEQLYVQALDIWKNVVGEGHPNYATSLSNLAFLYESMGEYARAEPLYLRTLEIDRKVLGDEHPDYATSLNNLAVLYWSMGEYARAEPLYVEACGIKKNVLGEEHPDYATSLGGLAVLYQSMGEYAKAEPLYLRTLEIERKVLGEEHPDYATSLNNVAEFYRSTGEYDRAERLHVQARDIKKKVLSEEHPSYATSLNNLAVLYWSMGEYTKAEPLHLRTLDIQMKVLGEEHPDYATSLNNLANLYRSMGEYTKAEPLYLRTLEIDRRVLGEEHPDYATSLNNLAHLYESMREYDRAEPLFVKARDVRKKVLGEEHPEYATSLNNLAFLYASMGEYAQAEPLYLRTLDIRKKVLGEEHPDCAGSLNNQALLYELIGEYALAEPLRLKAHRVLSAVAAQAVPSLSEAQARSWMRKNRPRTDVVLDVLRRQQKWDSSEAYAAVWETKGLVRRVRIGQSLSSDAPPAARKAFAELREARLKLAELVSATPSPEQAQDYLQALAGASERKEVLEKRLAELNTATARELTVRDAKVHDLVLQLPEGVAVVDFVRLAEWESFDTEIMLRNEDGDSETRTVKQQEPRPVYDAFVLRADQSATTSPAKWVPIGDAEPIEAAVSKWRVALTDDETPRGLGTKPGRIGDKPKVFAANPAAILRKRIWEKLEPHLEGIHTIVIIPDGALTRLPWAALPGRNDGEYLIHDYALTTASTGQQLYGLLTDPPIKTATRLLVTGGIDYDNRSQQPSIVGDPSLIVSSGRALIRDRDHQSWGQLPGAEKEVNAIVELWGNRGAVRTLSDSTAGEQSLARLLPQSRFAHLATHGFFDKGGEIYGTNLREQSLFETPFSDSPQEASVAFRNPLLMTGIVMAGANVPPEKDDVGLPVGEDGILTAEEISGLDLRNTELVTLSACETGLGDIAVGEGVYGLTRVLHKSGVRSVVASQWKVDDIATQELMIRFYENLWVKKQSKIEALRNAQLWMLSHPRELEEMGVKNVTSRGAIADVPERASSQSAAKDNVQTDSFFWSAFQLSGDWR